MTSYPSSVKREAIKLRQSGKSLGEISKTLKIAKSTASIWLKAIPLNQSALASLKTKRITAGIKGLKIVIEHRNSVNKMINNIAHQTATSIDNNNLNLCKIMCALLYWGEGGKTDNHIAFINSDPKMIHFFIRLLRKSFNLDESKFRVLVHIHEYHNESEIKEYWSNITNIPISQFTKSYLKPHTGINKKHGFKGTVRISYYDSKIASEIKATYNELAQSQF